MSKRIYLLIALILSAIIKVHSQANIMPVDTSVCYGVSDFKLQLLNNTDNILRWETSQTGTDPWISIKNQTPLLDVKDPVQTTWYRAVVETSGGLEIKVGATKVNVYPKAVGGNISGPQQVCASGNSFSMTLTGNIGNVDKWRYSTNAITWSDIAGSAGSTTLPYSNLANSGYFSAVIRSGTTCDTVNSKSLFVLVDDITLPGQINNATTVCETGNNGTLNLTAYKGDILRWEVSYSGGTPWNSVVNLTDTIGYQNLTSGIWYRALVKNGSCPESFSPTVNMIVNKSSSGGFASGTNATCSVTNSGEIILTGNAGSITNWQVSLDKGINWRDSIVVAPVLEYQGLTKTAYYRAVVKNGVCASSYSTNAKITIYPLPVVTFNTVFKPQATPMDFKNTSSINEGTIKQYYWDFGDGNGTTVKSPSHTYSNSGDYIAKLQAVSDKGCIDSLSSLITVYEVPKVNFEFSDVCLKSLASFANTSTVADPTVQYSWDFGDGQTALNVNTPQHLYVLAGSYKVTLKATTTNTSSSISRTITIYEQAQPGFEALSVCKGSPTTFVNHSSITKGYLTNQWNFDDGNTSTELNPVHLYADADSFIVRLITISNYNCKDTIFKRVMVNPNPLVGFSATDAAYGYANVFTNTSTVKSGVMTYSWDLGNGQTSKETSFEYIYSSAGNYKVTLNVKTDSACVNSVQKNIWVYPKPYVNFTFTNVCEYNPAYFNNQSTVSSGTLSYLWDFGDGELSSKPSPAKNYSAPGNYLVKLIAISSDGTSDSIFKEISIYPKPIADFSFNNVCDGYPVLFSNTSTVKTGAIENYLWDFGDGTNAIRATASKLYLNPGVYKARFNVTTNYGCIDTVIKDVTVYSNPVANFSINNVCFKLPVNLTNQSAYNSELNNFWDMGNGYTTSEITPYYVYPSPGTYTVKLHVSAGIGCSDSLERKVTIYSLPEVYAGSDTSTIKGFGIQLNAIGATRYTWFPADGLSDPSSATPIANPESETLYSLTGEDQNGCIKQDSILISIDDQLKIIATNIITPDGNGINDTWYIQNIETYPDARIVVYDRWGNKVFETKNYTNNWNGTNAKNDILPDGTYYYIIRFPDDSKVYNGAINILRNIK